MRVENSNNKTIFCRGMRDGVPIALGYLAVSFSLGIAAKNSGLTVFQSFLASLLCNASAGEYAGFTSIANSAPLIETAFITLIVNLRYFLMSCAMSQRISAKMPMRHRLFMSFFLTDEFFGISMAQEGCLNPWYTYGAVSVAAPAWAIGTALGAAAGNILPDFLLSALSVALFGMFLAVIIPPSKRNKAVCGAVLVCFAVSLAFNYIPYISALSEGMRVIIITLAISALAAWRFPYVSDLEAETDE